MTPTEFVVSSEAPFPVEVMVYEEDTFRVLSAGNHIREIRQPLQELQQEVVQQQSHNQGELVVRGSRWFAILHDFDRSDPADHDVVERLLDAISLEVQSRQITAIGIQALGSYHGQTPVEETLVTFRNFEWPECLQSLWLITKPERR